MAERGVVIKVGSRSSELAMRQTNSVVEALKAAHPGVTFTIDTMETIGDKIQDRGLQEIGETNLFTKELEKALAVREVDLLVHSLKDIPTTLPEGMIVSAICKREDPRDSLVLHPKWKGGDLGSLPNGSVIGTSSLRRAAELRANRPGLEFKVVRGNLNTRLKKLDEADDYDGLLLAAAGMKRLGWSQRVSQYLDKSVCMYAVGQGALGVETRRDDARVNSLVECLNHRPTLLLCSAERACLHALGGGCSVPVGVDSTISAGVAAVECRVLSLDGSKRVSDSVQRSLPMDLDGLPLQECRALGEAMGSELGASIMSKGADVILKEVKQALEHS